MTLSGGGGLPGSGGSPSRSGAAAGQPALSYTPSSSSAPSYAAFIPALSRPGPSAVPPPSIAERLAQSRAEGRRRAYNEAQREQLQSDQGGELPLLSPSSSTSANAPSASSRAGTSYLGATALAAQEAQRRAEMLQEKRRIAGPISPRSWRESDARGRPPHMPGVANGVGKVAGKGKGKANAQDAAVLTPNDRWRMCQAVRHFMGGDERLVDETRSQADAGEASFPRPASTRLVDHVLCQWVETLNEGTTAPGEDGYDYMRFDLRLVPIHLKARLLALAGRLAACQPLKGSTMGLLFLQDRGDEEEGDGDTKNGGDIPDTWEEDQDDQPSRPTQAPSQASADHAELVTTLDLSFASCKVGHLRSVLFGHLPPQPSGALRINTHLRKLSLAGWDQRAGRGRSGGSGSSILGSAALLGVLEGLPNLSFLSLAGATLDGPQGPNVAHVGQTALSKGLSDAAVFLRRLSRAAPRLQTLDLSFATGINGDAIAAVGWDATQGSKGAWPELKHLVLHAIAAFMSEDEIESHAAPSALQQPLAPAKAFAAAWHAAHHGLPQATSSPYLLDHQPGLGRSSFPHLGPAGAGEVTSAATIPRAGGGGIAARRREAQMREAPTLPWSWADGGDGSEGPTTAATSTAEMRQGEDQWVQALRAVSADLGAERGIRTAATPPGGEERMVRCPISAAWVERCEVERAKVLDAVKGRWGSAALRGKQVGDGSGAGYQTGSRKGCLVYF